MPKSYSQFKYADIFDLGLDLQTGKVFEKTNPLEPTDFLKTLLEINTNQALISEKAKSEFVIAHVLFEIARRNTDRVSFFSGANFEVDRSRGLRGFCDFIFSKVPKSPVLREPIFCIAEAKNDNFENGIPQCIAEMYAAQLYNQQKSKPVKTIFGCVTFGSEWMFLKLEGSTVIRETDIYYLNDLPRLLGILQAIVDNS